MDWRLAVGKVKRPKKCWEDFFVPTAIRQARAMQQQDRALLRAIALAG